MAAGNQPVVCSTTTTFSKNKCSIAMLLPVDKEIIELEHSYMFIDILQTTLVKITDTELLR